MEDMRRYAEPHSGAGGLSGGWDDGDDKSEAAKKHRRRAGEHGGGGAPAGAWHWPVAVGLPWGLTVCLAYLLLYTPHCPVSPLLSRRPSPSLLLSGSRTWPPLRVDALESLSSVSFPRIVARAGSSKRLPLSPLPDHVDACVDLNFA